jgi:hypothetical protein
MSQPSARSTIGHRIVMVIGHGVRRMAGRGLDTSLGAGRLTTTVAGFITTTTGPGFRAASFTRSAVGGDRHSSRSRSTSRLETTFVGTRCRITKEIHIRAGIVTIETAEIIVMIVRATATGTDGEIGTTMDHGVG